MSTLVCFHAHPDDEVIATGGTMLAASLAGHRVVLVVATGGEEGEPVPGVLAEGEELGERRAKEVQAAADLLGVSAVYFLGYRDSGMMGEPTNDRADCFWQAPVDEAAEQLATILRSESCDVLTVYDEHGNYGHPDHIQVHRVGHAAARLVGIDAVYEATMNRDHVRRMMEQAGIDPDDLPDPGEAGAPGTGEGVADTAEVPAEVTVPADSPSPADATAPTDAQPSADVSGGDERRVARAGGDDFGTPEALITHAVDVSAHLATKREAMVVHASQIAPDSFFLAMSDEQFAGAFGTEWFIHAGHPRPDGAPFTTDLFK